jgi:hypothetical protein
VADSGDYRDHSQHRALLERVRETIEQYASRSITFIEYCGHLSVSEQTLDEGWIDQYAAFVGRRLSYYVIVFADLHLALYVRDADCRDRPRKMLKYETGLNWIVRTILLLEGNKIATVQTNGEPITLKNCRGEPVLTIA